VLLVECEIQLQNIDSGFTENSEITPIGVLLHELANFLFAQAASFSDASDLQLGVLQTDVRIEAAAGRSDRICWNGIGFF
jgi:hypothetical protein